MLNAITMSYMLTAKSYHAVSMGSYLIVFSCRLNFMHSERSIKGLQHKDFKSQHLQRFDIELR